MSDFKELLKIKNESDKAAFWERVVERRFAYFQRVYNETHSGNLKNKLLEIGNYESGGGNCKVCATPWALVEFDNRFLRGRYYKPSCECYVLCPSCHRWLYDDFDDKNYVCSNCGWKYIVEGQKRYGIEYEQTQYELDRAEEIKKKRDALKPKTWGKKSKGGAE
jgi:hypothetical protein